MKTIIEEAIQAFSDRHEDRCLKITSCQCQALILRANKYEANIENRIRNELAAWLNEEKDRWVFNKDRSPLADWVASIWDNVIKYVENKK